MVARLTPDQKAACSSHVEVRNLFLVFISNLIQISNSDLFESLK